MSDKMSTLVDYKGLIDGKGGGLLDLSLFGWDGILYNQYFKKDDGQ